MSEPVDVEAIRKRNDEWKRLRARMSSAFDAGHPDLHGTFSTSMDEPHDDIAALLAEVDRLKANPDCPACGHSVTEEHIANDIGAIRCMHCLCVDWMMP